ncbi:MAG: GNAT family N-acetyltransferase [Anaerolineales bacterium]|nr:MAG: GNAT family N-acetyltransferase [Anaerolineales bacterium]
MDRIRIRPGRTADRAAVVAICAQAWEGEDYVPRVWDEWLTDGKGELAVAEIDGQVVGFAKLSRLGPQEWWLQGLRVDPSHRREGVAGRLHARLMDQVRANGRGTVRFATHSENEPVHRMSAHDRFKRVAAYRLYAASPQPAPDGDSEPPLRQAGLEEARAFLSDSPLLASAGGLYELRWVWAELTDGRLAEHAAAGSVWAVGEEGAPAGLAIGFRVDDVDAQHVAFIDGDDEGLPALLQGLRRMAARQQSSEGVWLKALVEPRLTEAVEAAGFEPGWDRDMWVFETET